MESSQIFLSYKDKQLVTNFTSKYFKWKQRIKNVKSLKLQYTLNFYGNHLKTVSKETV